VVEPFLQLMTEFKVTASRKQLPRTRIFNGLFDWLGVERKFRPSNAAINAIAKGLEASGGGSSGAFIPIVYDPTVADACLTFGHIYRRARTPGLSGPQSSFLKGMVRR
jgi:hypothetical protein